MKKRQLLFSSNRALYKIRVRNDVKAKKQRSLHSAKRNKHVAREHP